MGRFEIIGVQKVNKVENRISRNLHQPKKINFFPAVREGKLSDGTRTVLTFFIPEAPREAKPVSQWRYKEILYPARQWGHECSEEEIKTFLREAAGVRYDSELLLHWT